MKLPEHLLIKQEKSSASQSIRVKLHLTADLDFFDGHFEQMAILPAVAQLYIVKKLASRYLNLTCGFQGLRQLKFKSPITPKMDTEVLIERLILPENKQEKLQFVYISLGLIKSKGVFLFERAE